MIVSNLGQRLSAIVVILVAASLLVQCASPRATLKPFQSDGCSGFPDGTLSDRTRWRAHCVTHDLAYWQGGTADQRLGADRVFRKSIAKEGHPIVAEIAYLGVRFGGVPWWPTSWRWGYGWPYPRGYGALTSDERAQVEAKDPSL